MNLKENKCPLCNNDIYIYETTDDYCCVDKNCPMGHGARKYYEKLWQDTFELYIKNASKPKY